jgi:hypothetical protein
MITNSGSYEFYLPPDFGQDRLSLTIYTLSGRAVFKADGIDASKPYYVNLPARPGTYCAKIFTAKREIAKGRFAIVK